MRITAAAAITFARGTAQVFFETFSKPALVPAVFDAGLLYMLGELIC